MPALACSMLVLLCLWRSEAAWPSAGPADASCNDAGSSVDAPAVPDCFRQPQDGDDDAPSINRAITVLARSKRSQLIFRARIYLLKSPVMQRDVELHWVGGGWSEPTGATPTEANLGVGTWLVADRVGFTPVTITGAASRGTIVEGFGIFEKQPVSPTTGSWKPEPYPYFFHVEATYGLVKLQHMMFLAVTNGIYAHLSGRLEVDDVYGQVFDNAIRIDKSYDANTYRDLHFWPYWTQLVPVMDYIQNHFDAMWLQRADTGVIDNLFVFGARSGIHLDQSDTESAMIPGGAATKNTLATIHCDSTRWCVWITGYNVHFQADSIESQAQQWTGSGTSPVAMKAAAAIRIEGQAVIQVGRIWQEFTDHSTISYLNPRSISNIQVGSLYEDFTHSDSHPAHATVTGTKSEQSELFLSAPPMTVLRPDQSMTGGTEADNGLARNR